MILHHATNKQIDQLELLFAKLTSNGWVIPDWLIEMRKWAKS